MEPAKREEWGGVREDAMYRRFCGKELLFRRGRKVAENRVAMREAAESADNFAMVFRIPEIVVPVAVRISKRAKEANRFILLFEGLGVH